MLLVQVCLVKSNHADTVDLCTQESATMFCSCDGYGIDEAQSVTCYVFNTTELTDKSDVWRNFQSQTKIKYLAFSSNLEKPLTFNPLASVRQSTREMTHFRLTDSNLMLLSPYSFEDYPMLGRIELERNNIMSLEEKAFDNLPKLTILSLSDNKLKTLKSSYFKKFTNFNGPLLGQKYDLVNRRSRLQWTS